MQARNLADEQVGETVPGPPWLYSRHTDAVRPLRTQGAQNIRTRGALPHERSNIRMWLAVAHHQFSACRSGGVHIRIHVCQPWRRKSLHAYRPEISLHARGKQASRESVMKRPRLRTLRQGGPRWRLCPQAVHAAGACRPGGVAPMISCRCQQGTGRLIWNKKRTSERPQARC